MKRVVIVGGGWAGCAAAIACKKFDINVLLIERTDMLLGTGLVGGIMRNNGRYTASEEMIALGGGDLFSICDESSRHININFPGHKHASLYDIVKTHGKVFNLIKKVGIDLRFNSRIVKVEKKDNNITSIEDEKGNIYNGDVFIDATGTAGPVKNCSKYGNGCAMCIIRCPSFKGRVSLTGLCGIDELTAKKKDGSFGAMSGSCKIFKESLTKDIQNELNTKGVSIIPIPERLKENKLDIKACQQYALKEYNDNLILLDTGHAKLMSPFYNLDKLRKIPGLENSRYEDPYTGGLGNSMRFFDMAPRDDYMKVIGADNLFCCGEKAGLLVGHTEAIVTGVLAGYNSVRYIFNKDLFKIPKNLATGDAISYVNNQMSSKEGINKKYTFSGSVYFERMKRKGLYNVDKSKISKNINSMGLENIFMKLI
ncbi:MAG: FAD-dependent oxidoreductase [Firmicutes bacterium]|nr:FAD-dependent oxidoreductase [Bacillota bacterium]